MLTALRSTYVVIMLAVACLAAYGLAASVGAVPSKLHQNIFTAECTETTLHTGASISTAYGCPEPPTIETNEALAFRSPMVFEGWFDTYNKQIFKITFLGGKEYILGVDPQLVVVGDRWELRLTGVDILLPGTHTMTVSMVATNGSIVATSKQFRVVEVTDPETPVDPGTTPGVIGGGAGTSSGEVQGGSLSGTSGASGTYGYGSGGATAHMAMPAQDINGASDSDMRVVSDVATPLVEQIRRIVVSYVTPSWLLTFVVSALFFGYVFYLLGRHYRYLEERRKIQLKALKQAARKARKPATPRGLTHARKKRHA